jgi:GAF domain-containing protein
MHRHTSLLERRPPGILDSARRRTYDDITRALATSLDVPIAIVNMLDEGGDWVKSTVGLEANESPVAFCGALLKESDELIVVEDTLKDLRFSSHPLVTGPPFIRFYAAARLLVLDQLVGTLCAHDVRPRYPPILTPSHRMGSLIS